MKIEVNIYSPPYSSLPVVIISRFYLFIGFPYFRFPRFEIFLDVVRMLSLFIEGLGKKKCLIYKNTSGNWSWHHKFHLKFVWQHFSFIWSFWMFFKCHLYQEIRKWRSLSSFAKSQKNMVDIFSILTFYPRVVNRSSLSHRSWNGYE